MMDHDYIRQKGNPSLCARLLRSAFFYIRLLDFTLIYIHLQDIAIVLYA